MELRQYWKFFLRRWPFALVPAIVVAVFTLATYHAPAPVFNTGVRFLVGQSPLTDNPDDQQRYYNWLTSEYIVNGLTDWVRGGQFAQAVSAELAAQGIDVPAGAIQGGLAADNTRSMMTLSLSYSNGEQLPAIMTAVTHVLQTQNSQALPQLGGATAVLTQLDQPIVNQIPAGLRSQLDLPLRIALAFAAGLALAFLVEYLDPTVRDRAELTQLGIALLGEIPKP